MQMLSYLHWYHFAYLVVSLALLGFGSSGAILSLFRGWFYSKGGRIRVSLIAASSATILVAANLTRFPTLQFEFHLLFHDAGQIPKLLVSIFIYFLPFFTAALAIGLILTSQVGRIGKLYFANLLGSGFGALFALGLLSFAFPPQAFAITAILPILAGLISGRGRLLTGEAVLILISGVLCLFTLFRPPPLSASQFKPLSRTLQHPDARIVDRKPDPQGVLEVVNSPAIRSADGLSLNFTGEIPISAAVFINAESAGLIRQFDPMMDRPVLDFTPEILAYIEPPRNVLILEPEGNGPVAQALYHGAARVIAVSSHSDLGNLISDECDRLEEAGLTQGACLVENAHVRAFLDRSREEFELIRFPVLGQFHGSSGVKSLSTQYLFTLEAFSAAWDLLGTDGALTLTTWIDYPERKPLRLLATVVEMLEKRNIESPEDHLAAIRSWANVTFLVSKRPLSESFAEEVRSLSESLSFDPLLLPGIEEVERNQYNQFPDDSFFQTIDTIISKERAELYAIYPFNIEPTSDNRPFFLKFLRWRGGRHIWKEFGWRKIPFFEMGSFILSATFLLLAASSVLLIVLPLIRLDAGGRGTGWTFLYFGCLGSGFMMVEIALMQSLTLTVGHPVYANAIVLATLLLFSGLGSLVSARLPSHPKTLAWATGSAAILILLHSLFLNYCIKGGGGSSLATSIAIIQVLIAPLAFSMGFPFPLALRRLQSLSPAHLPWAWGINGCASVLSPPLAIFIAVEFGFICVLIIAALFYMTAMASTISSKSEKGGP